MDETYYLVKQEQHPETSFWDTHYVFISVSEGKLEHLIGDQIIFSLLELRDGELKISEEAQLRYNIIQFRNKTQYEFYRADSEGRTCGTGKTRTFRDPINKRIFIGEI